MKRLITWLVVLALVAYLGFKVAVWWLADQRAAELQDALSETALIDRGRIGSGVDGHLTIKGARYEDFRLTQPLEIGRLSFSAGSPVALVTGLLDPRNLPRQWAIEAEQLSMRLDGAMLRNWLTEGASPQQPSVLAPVCGPDHRQQLGTGDLVRMGITHLEGELLVRQQDDSLLVELHTDDTGSLELTWPGARLDLTAPAAIASTSAQPLTLILRDAGLMRRVSAYCARESGVDLDQWTGIVLERFSSGLESRGYRASDQLLALYRQWLREGGELTLALNPSQEAWGIPVREAAAETGPQADITYNGSRVPDAYLRRVPPEIIETSPEAVEPLPAPESFEPGWRERPLSDAGERIGQKVRVTLSTGRVVEGRLERVAEGEELEVTRMVNGGEVAYSMAVRAITRFEIWYRGGNR